MDLKSLRQRLARLATVTPPCRLRPGLVVVFRACDADGKLVPLPDVPHRMPEARDPARGLDVVFLDENGAEFKARCA
jgi:hypothetical protein